MDAQHDIVMALDRWAEDGVAPEKIIATHLTKGAVDRTLPLCPYPQVQIYNGAGDENLAENFHCEDRAFHWALEGVMPPKKPAASTASSEEKTGRAIDEMTLDSRPASLLLECARC